MLRLITPPTAEPVDTATAKAFLYVDHASDDALIDGMVTAARMMIEGETGTRLLSQTVEQVLSCFPPGEITLETGPVDRASIALSYIDADGASQVLSGLRISDRHGLTRLLPPAGEMWPATLVGVDAVTIQFNAGYANVATFIERAAPLELAIKQLVALWYQHRMPITVGTINVKLPITVQTLIAPYTVRVGIGL